MTDLRCNLHLNHSAEQRGIIGEYHRRKSGPVQKIALRVELGTRRPWMKPSTPRHQDFLRSSVAARLSSPVKAPRAMVSKNTRRISRRGQNASSSAIRTARRWTKKKIAVDRLSGIEEIQFGRGQALQFAATIETAPEFQLPEYKGLPAKREAKSSPRAEWIAPSNWLAGSTQSLRPVCASWRRATWRW